MLKMFVEAVALVT